MQPRLLRLCVAALAVAGVLFGSSRASADTIGSISLSFNSGPNGNGLNGGGAFHWTQQSAPGVGTAVTTYCIDLAHGIGSGTLMFDTHTDLKVAPTIGTQAKSDAITTLFDHYYASSFTYSPATATSPAGAISQAAFQFALWKLVYGNAYTIPTGTTADQKEAAIEANYLLAGKMFNGALYNNAEHDLVGKTLIALVSPNGNQDQIMVIPTPPGKGVPAPPAVMLAGIGVLALFGRARWTRRTPATAA